MDLAEIKAFKQRIAKEGKSIIHGAFKEFFEAHPEVEAVRWNQYTPHFNDGEPCVFNRHEFESKSKNPDGGDNSDGWSTAWGHEYDKADGWKVQVKALKALNDAIGSGDFDDLFEAAFGDGVEVTATSKGFQVEDYDHE